MGGYLIYHSPRQKSVFGVLTVYHDQNRGNQDPYVWNRKFLHTYCHMTQMSPAVHDLNFWVSGDTFPHFSHLYCDLVFVVEEKSYWLQSSAIEPTDPLVDSAEAFTDHYQWATQHPYKHLRRFTLKADPRLSFQPQDSHSHLLDIVPRLDKCGLSLEGLRKGLRAGFTSKPLRLDDSAAMSLYDLIHEQARVKLTGETLQAIRRAHPQLASPSRSVP